MGGDAAGEGDFILKVSESLSSEHDQRELKVLDWIWGYQTVETWRSLIFR